MHRQQTRAMEVRIAHGRDNYHGVVCSGAGLRSAELAEDARGNQGRRTSVMHADKGQTRNYGLFLGKTQEFAYHPPTVGKEKVQQERGPTRHRGAEAIVKLMERLEGEG
ncbi:807f82d2-9dc8-4966-99a3-7303003ff57d, partial [Thermothielavioides terrestris]